MCFQEFFAAKHVVRSLQGAVDARAQAHDELDDCGREVHEFCRAVLGGQGRSPQRWLSSPRYHTVIQMTIEMLGLHPPGCNLYRRRAVLAETLGLGILWLRMIELVILY